MKTITLNLFQGPSPVTNRLRYAGAVLLALMLLLVANAAYAAPTFPQLAGEPVVDAANLLDPAQEAALNTKLKALELSTGHQLAVATVPDLGGYDVADYGYQLGRAWGIGKQGANDGVVLIVAPNERRTRIEVGYGLEPVLTDAYSSVIINSAMIPKFKAGDYPGGIDVGVDEIAKQIQLPPEEAAKRAAAAVQPRNEGRSGIPGSIIFWLVIFFFFILPMLRGLGGRRHRRSSGLGEVILWSALNAAANSRDNDGGGWGGGGGFGGGGGGGFSGGGGSFGGGGASGGW
jgi:uncharacterized protein